MKISTLVSAAAATETQAAGKQAAKDKFINDVTIVDFHIGIRRKDCK